MNRSDFGGQAVKKYRQSKYSYKLKAVSRYYADIAASGNAGCRGYGAEHVAALFNKGPIYPLVAADAKEGLSAYNTGPKCKKWLEELDGEWEKMMDAAVKELNERIGVGGSEQLF